MSQSDTEKVVHVKTENKKAVHLGVLIGLVALVFAVDQLLFGTLGTGSFGLTSLKQLRGTADLLVGALLALAALQAYLWQSNSQGSQPKDPKAKTALKVGSKSDSLKAAQANLNWDLDRAFQRGAWKILAFHPLFALFSFFFPSFFMYIDSIHEHG